MDKGNKFGELVREWRKDHDIKQIGLAELMSECLVLHEIKFTQSDISEIEGGERPSIAFIVGFALATNQDIDDIRRIAVGLDPVDKKAVLRKRFSTEWDKATPERQSEILAMLRLLNNIDFKEGHVKESKQTLK